MKITIENINKFFGNVKALDNVSLEIADGELFFLLGPSGCGKTTLLRCLGGFEIPTSGRILLNDEDVSQRPPNKRNTAMVFQGYALWPHMTVYNNIAFGLEMQKLPKDEVDKRVRDAMNSVQISALGDRKPNELSGGQQQRVALARTLVVHPGCLLLDEPLANLDAKLRRDMRLEIRRLCKDNGLTGVYVTHDRQEALSMADRAAVLKDGKIIQIGTPKDIYRHPATAFVASFIGDTNFIHGTLKSVTHGCVKIETPAGIIRSDNVQEGMEPGTPVTLSIRPEAITIATPHTPVDANRIPSTLSSTAYMGEVADHTAITNIGNLSLTILELNPKGDAQTGAPTELAVNSEDVIVLPQDLDAK